MTLKSRMTIAAITAALLSAGLVGCAPDAEDKPETTSTAASSADGSGSDEADAGQDETTAESAAEAGIDLTDLGEPVATAEIPATARDQEDLSGVTMTVNLYGLERRGETLIGTFSFTPHTESEQEFPLYGYLGHSRWHPFLIDPVNLNKHLVLEGADGRVMTDSGPTSRTFGAEQTLYAYAVFAAPPKDVKKMDVAFVAGAPIATGVTIE